MILELNYINRVWYRDAPVFNLSHDEELRKFIKVDPLKKEKYYRKLLSWDGGKFHWPISYALKMALMITSLTLLGLLLILIYFLIYA